MTAIPAPDAPDPGTWDLAAIYPGDEAWRADCVAAEGLLTTFADLAARGAEGAARLLVAFRAADCLIDRLSRVTGYARLQLAADGRARRHQDMAARAAALNARLDAALEGMLAVVGRLPPSVLAGYLAGEPELAAFRGPIESAVRRQRHALSPDAERVLAALAEVLRGPSTLRSQMLAIDLRCAPARDRDGRTHPVSIASYDAGLSRSPDRTLRERSYRILGEGLRAHVGALAGTLALEVTRNVALARLRGYPSAIDMLLDAQRVPRAVYDAVLDDLSAELAPHARRLLALRGELLGIPRARVFDLAAPLPGAGAPMELDRAMELIQDAVAVLGPEHVETVERARRERWVDHAERPGKSAGDFTGAVCGVHPYILTSWHGTIRNAFILGHELGHAAHAVIAERASPISLGWAFREPAANLFWGEAPALVAELLLGDHLLHGHGSATAALAGLLETFTHNLVTHLLEARFERALYRAAEESQGLGPEFLEQAQDAVLAEFFGEEVTLDPPARLLWATRAHYFVGLYPYTYAAGLAVAATAAGQIRAEGRTAARRWLEVLAAPPDVPPVERLARVGVDFRTDAPIRAAVRAFAVLVGRLAEASASTPPNQRARAG